MPERKLDLSKLDQEAQKLGFEGIDLLNLEPRFRSALVGGGFGDLSRLDQARLSELLSANRVGPLTIEHAQDALTELKSHTLRFHIARLRAMVVKKKEPKVPKTIKDPLLPQLAEPFYYAVGQYSADDWTIREFESWRFKTLSDLDDQFNTANNRINRTHQLMEDFMLVQSRKAQTSIDMAFRTAAYYNLITVGFIRGSSFDDLIKIGKVQELFCILDLEKTEDKHLLKGIITSNIVSQYQHNFWTLSISLRLLCRSFSSFSFPARF